MQPLGSRKRKSDQLDMSGDAHYTVDMANQKVPTKDGSSHPEEGPSKRQRVGITLAQKQALIDNLQLELTERARKLRANYNIHAQSLRTRIEIRVNRIPMSLRKLTMGELLEKYSKEPQQKPSTAANSTRGPPVPAKDMPSRPPIRGTAAPASAHSSKRRSHEISGGDKENEVRTPQKKIRGEPGSSAARNPATHVLSPTTTNSRVAPRTVATPGRTGIARPAVTPGRAAMATNILNRMVDSARSTARGAATPAAAPRNTTTTTTTSAAASSTNNTTTGTGTTSSAAAARRKRGATVSAHQAPRPATQTARRASGTSESSEASTGTVIRKRPMTAPPGAQPKPPAAASQQASGAGTGKRTVMGTIRKGVASGTARKAAPGSSKTAGAGAGAAGSAAGTGTGRVLRKRA